VLFDPLDREILERALDSACAAAKEFGTSIKFESDEDLEAELWRGLIEIALQSGISDPETLAQPCLSSTIMIGGDAERRNILTGRMHRRTFTSL